MGVAKKGKRRIVVDNREYYWHVKDSEDFYLGASYSLNIISEDKQFLVRYPLLQTKPYEHNVLIVLGKQFGGVGKWGGRHQTVKCPNWETHGVATPSLVEKIIRWSLAEKDIQLIDHRGKLLEQGS